MQEGSFYVGIDWGRERHAICVMRRDGSVVKKRFVENDATALLALAELIGDTSPNEVFVGVETRRLAIVDALVARGYRTFSINPKQVDRFRDRFSPAGAKDDRRDAEVIASSLRTDTQCFDVVEPENPEQRLLRSITAGTEYVEHASRAAANRLYHLVVEAMPTLASLCPSADEPWFWELLLALLAVESMNVDDATLAELLRKHRIRRFDVADLRAVLDKPRLPTAPGVRVGVEVAAKILVEQLRLLHGQRKELALRLRDALAAMPKGESGKSDAEIVRSLPGIGDVTAAALLVEGHQALVHHNLRQLRGLAGVAPVQISTGKKERKKKPLVVMRRASSTRLRNAMHHAANTARRDPRFAPIYLGQMQRGASHGHACRVVADRMLTIVVAMLRTRTEYRPPVLPQPSSTAVEP